LGSTAATGSFEDAGTPGLGASLGVSGAVSSASVHLSAALTGSGAANASSSVFSAPAGAARAHSPSPAGSRLPPGSFGLLDLLPVIRATDADVTAMALGTDLNALGLNLNAADVLYPTFGSPWADAPVRRAADYTLPACYYIAPPTLKTSHLSKFAHETLLYVFYNMPRDQMQVLAAKELYNRGWKYHKQLQLWFKSDSAANPAQPVQPLYFDVPTWKTRPFQDIQATRQLAANFMTAEEVMSL
jgi:CCR4-NOT transcription complex subunit 2